MSQNANIFTFLLNFSQSVFIHEMLNPNWRRLARHALLNQRRKPTDCPEQREAAVARRNSPLGGNARQTQTLGGALLLWSHSNVTIFNPSWSRRPSVCWLCSYFNLKQNKSLNERTRTSKVKHYWVNCLSRSLKCQKLAIARMRYRMFFCSDFNLFFCVLSQKIA